VLTTRGVVLGVGIVVATIAGLTYGVEEFVFLALSVAVLFALGALSVSYRRHATGTGLRVVVTVPVAEVTTRHAAVVTVAVTNEGRRRRPPVLVEDPAGHWSVSHPGLGASSVAGARRGPPSPTPGPTPSRAPSPGFPSFGQRSPSGGWLGGAGTRPDRHQRARDRRSLSLARRLPGLGSGEHATLSMAVPTHVRGLVTMSGVGLWCEDPFGLIARRVTVAPPAHVIVYPAPADVAHDERAPGAHPRGRGPSQCAAGTTNALSGDELSGLRPYEPGDRLTRLHWPSLARSGELVVREFLEPRAGSLSLLVDLRPSAHAGDSIEKTIARAAGFGIAALERGLTVELCTSTGDRMVVTPNTAGRQTMLRALALLGPASAPPAVVRRWGDRPVGGAVWATGSVEGADVVLVTTPSGAAEGALPESIRGRAETVLVP
jgi:uncharacterized protein (DUF58 family)